MKEKQPKNKFFFDPKFLNSFILSTLVFILPATSCLTSKKSPASTPSIPIQPFLSLEPVDSDPLAKYFIEQDQIQFDNLLVSIKSGAITQIEQLIKNNSGIITQKDCHGKTALHHAIEHRQESIAKLLLQHNRDLINQQDQAGCTALHLAAEMGIKNIVELLYTFKPDSNLKDHNNQAALDKAAQKGHTDIIKYLLNQSTNSAIYNQTVAHAIIQDHLAVVKTLLENKLSWLYHSNSISNRINDIQIQLDEFLHLAVANRAYKTTCFLLSCGANPNYRAQDNKSPMHLASQNSDEAIAKKLIKYGTQETFQPMNVGRNLLNSSHPSTMSIQENYDDCENLLKNSNYRLHQAVRTNDQEAIKLLIQGGENINELNDKGETALHYAVERNNVEMVGLLLEHDAQVSILNAEQLTPLQIAAEHGSTAIMKKLLAIKYNPLPHVIYQQISLAAKNELKNRKINIQKALYCAVKNNQKEAVHILRQQGAIWNIYGDEWSQKIKQLIYRHTTNPIDQAIVDIIKKLPSLSTQNTSTKLYQVTPQNKQAEQANFYLAIQNNNQALVAKLLNQGVSIHTPDNQGKTALEYAAQTHNPELIKLLLKKGANPCMQDNGFSLMTFTILNGYIELFPYLVPDQTTYDKWECDLFSSPLKKETKLHNLICLLAEHSYEEELDGLVKQGVNIDTPNEQGWTPLQQAFMKDKIQVAKLLQKKGGNINIKIHGTTLLHEAVKDNNRQQITHLLITFQANPRVKNQQGHTPLATAATLGHINLFLFFIQSRQLKELQMNWEKSRKKISSRLAMGHLIYMLADYNYKDELEQLLKLGISIDYPDFEGYTPLQRALIEERMPTIKLLQAKGANNNIKVNETTLLHEAVKKRNHRQIIYLLTSLQADVHVRDTAGCTPLLLAARLNYIDLFPYLVKTHDFTQLSVIWKKWLHEKASSLSNSQINNFIYMLADHGYVEELKSLLQQGISIEQPDEKGLNSLQRACIQRNYQAVDFLLKNKLNFQLKTNEASLLHWAVSCRDHHTVDYLLKQGTDLDPFNEDGYTPLINAAYRGYSDFFPYFIKDKAALTKWTERFTNPHGQALMVNLIYMLAYYQYEKGLDSLLSKTNVSIDIQEENGHTALSMAVIEKATKAIPLLLHKGANPNCQNNDGKITPLMLAIRHGNIQAAVILLAHGADHKIKDAYGRTINEHCSGSNPAIAHFLQTIKQLDEQGLNIQVYFQTYPLVGLPMQSSWQAAAQQDPQTRLEKLPKKRPLQYVPEQYNTHKKAHQ